MMPFDGSLPGRAPEWTPEQSATFRALWAAGAPPGLIKQRLGMSWGKIHRYRNRLRKLGQLPPRKLNGWVGCDSLGRLIGDRDKGNRWRGRLSTGGRAHPLVRQLFEEMNRQRATLAEVADRVGIERGSLSSWRWVVVPQLDNFVAAANALGLEVILQPAEKGHG